MVRVPRIGRTARAELVESADAAALDLDGRTVHTSVDHELAGWGSRPHPSTTRPIKLTIKAGDVMKGVGYADGGPDSSAQLLVPCVGVAEFNGSEDVVPASTNLPGHLGDLGDA